MKHRLISDGWMPALVLTTLVLLAGRSTFAGDGPSVAVLRGDGAAAVSELKPATGTTESGPTLGTPAEQRITAARPTLPDKLDTPLLRQIEDRGLPPRLTLGPNRYGELPDYYWAENRELRERLEHSKRHFTRVPLPRLRALTLVAGAAGVGKTFIKGKVFDKKVASGSAHKFDLKELYDEWAREGFTADRPDLVGDQIVISRLKAVVDKSRPRLREYLEAHDCRFYVIDSLDEIHPDDYAWVLEQVEDFVFHRDRRFVHAVVFGRGFAFREFWHKRTEHRTETDVRLYLLNPPALRTTGDLLVSSWNYHRWKYSLAWSPDGGQACSMPLDAYSRWARSGFSRDGEFRGVTCKTNDDMRTDTQDLLVDHATRSRLVCSALYNLAGNSLIREILCRDKPGLSADDQRRVADAYLAAWLVRETRVHDRPSDEKPEYRDLYLDLLGQVAVKYLRERKVDEDGFFPVDDQDRVVVLRGSVRQAFPVRDVLERSGLIFTDPREPGTARYRFEPVWMHRLLVERHGERLAESRHIASGTAAE